LGAEVLQHHDDHHISGSRCCRATLRTQSP
jgi:hypothetical protein